MAEINLVPRDRTTFEDFSRFARDRGWQLDQRSVRAARGEESPEFLWRTDNGSTVRLIQSAPLDLSYVVVAGDERDRLADEVRERFPAFSWPEIIERLSEARSDEERIAAFRLVAATESADYDPTVYGAVRTGLDDSDPLVLLAALGAAFYLRWRQFEPLVRRVSESPQVSENVRVTAGNLLGLTLWDRGHEGS
ncbi:hypothetical protein GA0070604_2983 [Micromonospora eburnea]|uniref:HEAT repeat-containing protein n=2 Tax=Micromonospora eburnea TaxID=227316 RepID=A0A1C6UJW1_9ACTN|nr:hypothetical protein GA0070604_2983 [Micromonospora eburnea]